MNNSKSIIEVLKNWLFFLEESGYRYFKTRTSFEKKGDISNTIIIDVGTHDAGLNYYIAFYYGVLHSSVSKFISEIEERKITIYDITIYQYSVNDTPVKLNKFTKRNDWWIAKDTPIEDIKNEVLDCVNNLILYRINRWQDLILVRQDLECNKNTNIIIYPFKPIIAIDYILNDREHYMKYISSFNTNYIKMADSWKKEATAFFRKIQEKDIPFFKGVTL